MTRLGLAPELIEPPAAWLVLLPHAVISSPLAAIAAVTFSAPAKGTPLLCPLMLPLATMRLVTRIW